MFVAPPTVENSMPLRLRQSPTTVVRLTSLQLLSAHPASTTIIICGPLTICPCAYLAYIIQYQTQHMPWGQARIEMERNTREAYSLLTLHRNTTLTVLVKVLADWTR